MLFIAAMHARALPFFLPNWKIFSTGLWLSFFAWLLLLGYASTRPMAIEIPPSLLPVDKFLHFSFFFVGALSLGSATRATLAIRWATLFALVLMTLSLCGLGDEISQLFVSGRNGGDPLDWLADFVGSASGLMILRQFYAKQSRENPEAPAGN